MGYIVLSLLKFYKKILSPILHVLIPGCGCRFFPTCSEYGYRAIEKYGVIIGTRKAFKRIIRCHPFSKGRYDPV